MHSIGFRPSKHPQMIPALKALKSLNTRRDTIVVEVHAELDVFDNEAFAVA